MFLIIILSFLLRPNCGGFFAANRECLDLLFKASSQAIMSWCEEKSFTPGLTAVMHTFGSILDFHPHIHTLLSEGGIGKESSVWKDCGYFPHQVLKERFKYHLIKDLREYSKKKLLSIPESLKQIWQRKLGVKDFFSVSVKLYKVIWYVWIGEKLDNANFTVGYIGRYAKRPCLSEAKIVYYSFEKQMVSFVYKDKISKTFGKEIISVEEFISRLIRHIPEKNFRMIRHYGFYANCVKNKLMPLLKLQISLLFSAARFVFSPNDQLGNWRERIERLTGSDPLVCPNCKMEMKLVEIAYRTRDGTLRTINIS